MAQLTLVLLAIALSCIGVSNVQACESACRGDPVTFLTKHYQAVLEHQANKIVDPKSAAASKKLIPKVISRLQGRGKVIDKTIFDKFRGSCENDPGKRKPDEFCGSAKSIACFAPWGHRDSVFDSVLRVVVKTIGQVYQDQGSDIKDVMVQGVADFCPQNCHDWVEPFQDIMLVWEQREHPSQYHVTPNCLPLGKGGI
ncbi:hypothetical protein BGX26_002471 [Mortierella sp. AD094]|nr:hypothetical protein BGX26_002471 [Mortierella sp. AD094]